MASPAVAGEDETLVEILEASPPSSASSPPIDIAKYVGFVRDPKCGAIATFEGTTRDTFEGKQVVELRYEAYVPMAVRQLRSICSSARSAFPVRRIAVAHRLGTVPVGEGSVFVAVSSVHRADGLDACRYIIDELKASVPIWKKEVYANGEVWKENSEFFGRGGGVAAVLAPAVRDRKGGCCGHKVKVEEGSSQ